MTRRHGHRAVGVTALLILTLSILVTACRADADVSVEVRPDGSGTVLASLTLDRDAAVRLGDPGRLDTSDLVGRGWQVDPPEQVADGGLRLSIRRPFASPEELAVVLDDLTGADGPLGRLDLTVESSQLSTSYSFAGTLTSSGDPAAWSDPDVAAVLGGLPLGRTPEELVAIGADRPETAVLRLRVDLPGGVEESWSVPLTGGRATEVAVDADSTVVSPARVLGLLGVAALLTGAVVVAFRSRG